MTQKSSSFSKKHHHHKSGEEKKKHSSHRKPPSSTNREDPPGLSDIDLEDGLNPDHTIFKLNDTKDKGASLPLANHPFAHREGKTLIWKNVNMTLKGKKDGEDRKLLSDVWGEVPQQKTTAIMGPSGAGKTSLLNILAGRATSHGNLSIESDIRLNNAKVDPTKIHVRQGIAFVAQDDSLQPTSTPREAIYFSAKLRLPKDTLEAHLLMLVDRMLEELGLAHCADTIVGGPLLKGISGGERKRTSVGVELVVKPNMVFLDEPTSGLDSYSAVQLCTVLKKVANAGASVLFTIHQPASEIFNAFDRLILMNKGRVMYQGEVPNVPTYFKKRGHSIPFNYNPADWIMHVAQSVPIKTLENQGYFPKDTRILPEPVTSALDKKSSFGISFTRRETSSTARSHGDDSDTDVVQIGRLSLKRPAEASVAATDSNRVSIFTQISMLFSREMKNLKRDKKALGGRLAFTTILTTLMGIIFYDVARQDPGVVSNLSSHFGALTMVLINAMFGTAQASLLAFPQERPIFLREYSTNHYSAVSYFLSRLTVEVLVTALQMLLMVMIAFWMIGFQSNFWVFYLNTYGLAMTSTALAVLLGCSVEDPKLAQEMLPVLFVPQLLFAGFFVSPSLMPSWLRWARYIFGLTYSVRIGLVEELSNCPGEMGAMNCKNMLASVDADPDETWWYWLVLICLFVGYRSLALFNLRRKATKFL